MTVPKAILGGLMVASIYLSTFLAFGLVIVFIATMFPTHPVLTILFFAAWIFYVIFIGYIFSAHKLLDMRWTVTQVRRLLGE